MTILIRPYPVLPSADELHAFESDFGFELPSDYRSFLLDCNGGTFQGSDPAGDRTTYVGFYAEAVPPLPSGQGWIAPGNFWDIALFHGLSRQDGQYGDLRDIYPVMRDWGHPDELLPIASQAGNAKYFLCAAGTQRGRILFPGDTYLEKQADGQPITPGDYHCLAESFGDLLDGLVWRHS